MRLLVCTVVHHPEDARILHRQIRAFLDSGHEVVYAAPFTDYQVSPWSEVIPVDLPRSVGRSRTRALRVARRTLARDGADVDLVVVHDPELLVVLPLLPHRVPVVWDVHEDTAAALATKHWIPRLLRPALRPMVRAAEAVAERQVHLVLAEQGYRARFRRTHPVAPNSTYIPDAVAAPDDTRVIYVGQLSHTRGAGEMIGLAETLRRHDIRVDLVGAADSEVRPLLARAQDAGLLRWHGFVPNDRALRMAERALAGLSLLRDLPNYRHSQPTKVVEYMARGVPVITTPNWPATDVVRSRECGLVVPFEDPDAAAAAVLRLRDDPVLRQQMGHRGHQAARELFCWPRDARPFVKQLEEWAGQPTPASA